METFAPATHNTPVPRIPGHDPLRMLGSGSQGQVWLMSPHDGSAPVAAKILAVAGEAAGEQFPAGAPRHNEGQITQEWRVLSQFRHEHLIPMHRLVRSEQGSQVLLMEFAAGGSLSAVVAGRGPLSIAETVTVLTPLGQVLAHLHARGVVHGDISPGNVLFTAAGKPMLADLGCAALVGQGGGALSGTPGFYCPLDERRDAAADVYALASLGWFALTGSPAPATANRMPLGSRVKDVPAELLAALEAGLQEDPLRRPTAAALAQAVFRSARAEPLALGTSVHPSVLPELPTRRDTRAGRGRWPQRHRHPAWQRRGSRGWAYRVRASLRHAFYRSGGSHGRRQLEKMWDGNGRRRRFSGRSRFAAGAVVFALVLAATVAAVPQLRVLVLPAGQQQGKVQVQEADRREPEAPPWAAALPAQVQSGLVAKDPLAALPALAWTRSYAFSTLNAGLLGKVNAVDSPAAAADGAILRALQDRGHTLTGLESSVTETARTDGGSRQDFAAGTATVAALVTTSAFAEQDAQGTVVHKHAAAAAQRLVLVMVKVEGRWVVSEVRDPP